MNGITYDISGIKCDGNGCGYHDDSVTLADYPAWLNKPCPNCGANLLTQADLDAVQMTINACDLVNALGLPVKANEGIYTVRMNLDGSGSLNPTFEACTESKVPEGK